MNYCFPKDLDILLFNYLKYKDLVNAILLNGKYETLENRRALDSYIKERIIKDFFYGKTPSSSLYFDDNETNFTDCNIEIYKYIFVLIDKGIEPIQVYDQFNKYTDESKSFKNNRIKDILNKDDPIDELYELPLFIDSLIQNIKSDDYVLIIMETFIETVKSRSIDDYNLLFLREIKTDIRKIQEALLRKYLDKNNLNVVGRILIDGNKDQMKNTFKYLSEKATNEQLTEILYNISQYMEN